MSRSRSEAADLRCPSCGLMFQAEVWLVIDRQERPDLYHLLLDGELNQATCPHCGAEGGLNHPLLFHDAPSRAVVCAVPLSVQGQDAVRTMVGELLTGLVMVLPQRDRLPYLAEVDLVPELDGLRAYLIERTLGEERAAEDHLIGLALQDLLNVGDPATFQRVVAEHRQLLLSERARQALDELALAARANGDRELRRRVREATAMLGRMRGIVAQRRQVLLQLLDQLAPLQPQESEVVPALRRMLEAIDPQEVYAARIALTTGQQELLDRLVDRLAEQAEVQHEPEALAFVRTLQLLPNQ